MDYCKHQDCIFTDCEYHTDNVPIGVAYDVQPMDESCERLAAHMKERTEETAQQDRLNRMTLGDAFVIFQHINADSFTDLEKALAVKKIAEMETHMGVTKTMMLEVIRWLLDKSFEFTEEGGEG